MRGFHPREESSILSTRTHKGKQMKVYIIYGYSYEEGHVVYISKDAEVTVNLAKSLTAMARAKDPSTRSVCFCVLRAEMNKLYHPGLDNIKEVTETIWDEHNELSEEDK